MSNILNYIQNIVENSRAKKGSKFSNSASERRQDELAAVPRDRACHGHRHVRRDLQGGPLQGQEPGRTPGRNRQIS